MSVSVKPVRVGGLPVLAITALGSVFFGYALFTVVRPVFMWPDELIHDHLIVYVSFIGAVVFGLVLELRTFVRLAGKVETSPRNLWLVLEIHLRILCGVLLLVVFPVGSLSRFPEKYEREMTFIANHDQLGLDPHFDRVMFVAIQFIMIWVFIRLGLMLLEGVQKTIDRMTASVPAATH